MDKNLILSRRMRRLSELHQIHEAAECLRSGQAADGDIAHIKALARDQQHEIVRLSKGDASELLTSGELIGIVMFATLPVLVPIGTIVGLAAAPLLPLSKILFIAVFFAIAAVGGGFATNFIWDFVSKNAPKLWAKYVGKRRFAEISEDLSIIRKHC